MPQAPINWTSKPPSRWNRRERVLRKRRGARSEDVIFATGADAGIPGAFTPAGAQAPYNFSQLTGIVANPLTTWTVGQSVVLGDASEAHWDGAAWAVGAAPA